MTDVLRIKRRASGAVGAPTALANAELAFNEVDHTLYYGSGDSGGNATNIIPVAGPGAFLPLAGGTEAGHVTFQNGIDFNNAVASGPQDTSQGITLWSQGVGSSYGFAVTSNTLNYNTVAGWHDFYSSSQLLMRVGNGALTSWLPLSVQNTATINGTLNVAGATVMQSPLWVTAVPSATQAQLYIQPPGGTLALESKMRFHGTFHDGTTDVGVRFVASLRSGFAAGAWSGEYLDIWTNNQPNDANSDANQSRIIRFTLANIALGAGVGLTLDHDPIANLGAATKQYVDNHAPLGGPYLPLSGGTVTGYTTFPGLGIFGSAGTGFLFSPNNPQGAYNPISQTGDAALITYVGAPDMGALTLMPWSNTLLGIRIDNVAKTIAMYATNGITVNTDPTANLGVATKQYVDNHQPLGGPYLPLVGGTLSGGLHFGSTTVGGASDLSRHISLYEGYCGLSVTGGRMNLYSQGSSVFVDSANSDIAYFDASGLTMGGGFGINAGSVSASGTLTVQGASLFNNDVSVNSVNLWVGSSAAVQPHLTVQSATNQGAGIRLYAGNYQRWLLALDAYPESTDNTNQGGNLAFYAFADTGSFINTMLSINRADGYAYFSSTIHVGRDPTAALEVATMQYVGAKAGTGPSTITPLIDSGALIGSDTGWSRGDHVHPTVMRTGTISISSGSRTLAVNEIAVYGLYFYGATGPTTLTFPVATTPASVWQAMNIGNYPITLQGTGGGTITLPAHGSQEVWTDGGGIYAMNTVTGTPGPGDSSAAVANTYWVSSQFLPLVGGTLTGDLGISVADNQLGLLVHGATKGVRFVANATAFNIEGVDNTGVGSYQPLTLNGSVLNLGAPTMALSTLTLHADPTSALQAATMQYVDAVRTLVTGSYLPLAGGTLSGPLTVNSTLSVSSNATFNGGVYFQGAGLGYQSGMIYTDANFGCLIRGHAGAVYDVALADNAGTWWVGLASGGLLTVIGAAQFQSTVALAADPTTALQAATKQYVDNHAPLGGPYLPLSGGTISGSLTVQGTTTLNGPVSVFNALSTSGPITSGGILYVAANIAAPPPPGGSAAIGWNLSQGGGEVDFFNTYNSGSASFAFHQVTGSGTTNQLATITNTGALSLRGAGIAYGVSGGGNQMGFAWSGNIEAWVDGSHVGTLAGQAWVNSSLGSYLPLTGGTLSNGLHFGTNLASGPTDTSHHITLWDGGYGFSVTSGTLNNVAGGALDYYPNGGLVMRLNASGMQMFAGAIALLADPTGPLQATTKQYVDALIAEPVNVKWPAYGARGNGSTDDTTAIQNALNTGLDVYLPGGTYIISQQLNMTTFGQRVLGAGRSRTFIKVNGPSAANFPTAIIYVNNAAMTGGADFNVTFADFTMWCVQPDTSVRANLNSYPPMIYLDHAGRSQITNVRLVGGLDGLYMNGNNGGFRASGCDFGCFSINIFIDGNLDVTSFTDCEVWCFSATGIMTVNQQKIFWDANCYGIYSKRNDYLDWKGGLFMVGRAAQFDMGTRSDWPGPTYGHFTGTGFDSFGGLGVSAGDILTDNCTFSVGGDPNGIRSNSALVHTGGVVTIRGGKFFVGAVNLIPNQSLIWTGCGSGVASLIIEACEFEMGAADVRAIYAETSNNAYDSIQIANNKFSRLAGYAYTTAAVQINGGGGTLIGNVCGPGAGSMTGSVPALGMGAGIGTWLTANNNWHGWTTGVTGSTVTAQNLLQLPPVVGDAMAIVQVNGNATIGGMSILGEVGANPAFAGIFVTLLFAGTCTVNAGGYAIAGQFLLNNGTAFNTRPGSHLSVRLSTSGNWVEIGRCY